MASINRTYYYINNTGPWLNYTSTSWVYENWLYECSLTNGSYWDRVGLYWDFEGLSCSHTNVFYPNWFYTILETVQYTHTFNYATKTSNNKLVNYNSSIIESIRIIPFSFTVFGFNLWDFLNSAIVWTISFVIQFSIYPINIFNDIVKDIWLLFVDFPSNYCYYGMSISKLLYTPTNIVPSGQYTTNIWIWFFILMIFAYNFSIYLSKKI